MASIIFPTEESALDKVTFFEKSPYAQVPPKMTRANSKILEKTNNSDPPPKAKKFNAFFSAFKKFE